MSVYLHWWDKHPLAPRARDQQDAHLEDGVIPTLVSRTPHTVGSRHPLLRDQGILELETNLCSEYESVTPLQTGVSPH